MTAWDGMRYEPTHAFDYEVLDTLELLLGGLLNDTSSYSLPNPSGANSANEPTLQVPVSVAAAMSGHGSLLMADPDGTPLARLEVSDQASAATGEATFLAGRATRLQPPEHGPGRTLRITRPLTSAADVVGPVAAMFDNPPRAEELARAIAAAQRHGSNLRLVAITETAAGGTRQLSVLLDALQSSAAELANTEANLLVVPDSGNPASGTRPTPKEQVLDRLGASQILDFTSADPSPGANESSNDERSGVVVLFTGLSGSGKSTLARALVEQSHRVDARKSVLLDGDDVRRFLTAGLGFSREDRNTNVERIGWVASLVSAAGGIAVCAPIAPFEESRRRVREFAEDAGGYILVHVSTPLEVCEQRDRKGLYAKARAGQIPDFTGIDSPYEEPASPDYIVDTSVTSVEQATHDVLRLLRGKGSLLLTHPHDKSESAIDYRP